MDLMDYRRKVIASSPHLSHAEGAVATFADGTDLPLKNLMVNIEPVQSGTGDPSPSNIRPISGWDAVEVHNGNTVVTTISLGRTVYGGTLNPLTGVLTVDRAMVDLGTLDWRMSGSGNTAFHYANTSALGVATNISTTLNYICSNYSIVAVSSGGTATGMAFTSANQLRIRDATYASASDFKTAMDGVMLCYEVANPAEVQLTPHQIRSLYGNNTIFADTGNVALEYWAHA